MATTLIHNGCFVGALGAIFSGRPQTAGLAASYASAVAAASSFADEVAVKAADVSLADADLATPKMELTCAQITFGILQGRNLTSTTDADYIVQALAAAAAVKAAIAGWV